MNEERFKRWMDAIDDEFLEEAQRPLPRASAGRRWGALAACLCAAALTLALWQPWSKNTADEGTAGDNGGAAFSALCAAPQAEQLSASLALPENAALLTDYDLRRDESGAVTAASCTVEIDGLDYSYGAVYTTSPLPAPDGSLPDVSWQVGGLTLLVYDDGAVGWYSGSSGIQWYCAADDNGGTLVTAFAMISAQAYDVPTAPEGAEVLGYDLFELDGETVTEVTFAAGGQTWRYRMMPTADVTEHIPDISGYTGGEQTAEGQVLWCAASLRWDEGGTGCIIWKDVVPGLAYSLTTDSGATETLLIDMAAQVFQPAQDEAG